METNDDKPISILLMTRKGRMLAYCLDFDIVAQGSSWEEAEYRLFRAIAIAEKLAERGRYQLEKCAPPRLLRAWDEASRVEKPRYSSGHETARRLAEYAEKRWGGVQRRLAFNGDEAGAAAVA